MRGLVAEEDDPVCASRPFDATRAGFVMGEGAGVLMLEELGRARSRGATVYAEVLGYGASNDAYHMAAPDPEAVGVTEMMQAALARSGIEPTRVGYINAHGTSTPLGDEAETKAIRDVFGAHAYEIAVSSTKSTMGHLLGAAGAVEGGVTALAIHHGVIRRQSTTGIPIPPVTSITSPTTPGTPISTSRFPTRWDSAATTAAYFSAVSNDNENLPLRWPPEDAADR